MYELFFKKNNLLKKNYLNNEISVLGGFFLVVVSITLWIYLFNNYQIKNLKISPFFNNIINQHSLFSSMIYLFIIVSAVGFLDDLAGNKTQQGFKGHFKTLLSGKITTGFLKAFISFLVVFLVLLSYGFDSYFRLFLDLGIILLITNFVNLLDLRPARAIKFFLVFSFVLVLFLPLFAYFIPVYIALIFYLPFELKAKMMLGDTGANFLGSVLGFPIVFFNNLLFETILLLLLIILTVISEKYSYSKIIEQNRFMNYIDQLGRPKYDD